jgi:hypothetical protein
VAIAGHGPTLPGANEGGTGRTQAGRGQVRVPASCLRVPIDEIGAASELRPMADPAAPEWYALSQATMCLGAAWAILAMWGRGTPVRAGEPAPAVRRDRGLLWLGAGVAIWGVTGLVLLLPTATAMRPFLSSANSACLLLFASHLDYGPEILQRAREWRGWGLAATIGSLGVAAVTLTLYVAVGARSLAAQIPDVLLSGVVLLLYGFGLFRSFLRRGFVPLAVLAGVAVVLQAVAQLPEVTDLLAGGDRRWALNLASKSLTLVLFLALATSWVHEVARRPATSTAQLFFTGAPVGTKTRKRYLVTSGATTFEMRETPHRDLLALAVRRVSDGPDGGWIALPDLVGRLDDSRIRRVREDLRAVGLDAAVESNFQKAYRLALAPDKIGFDKDVLAKNAELAEIARKLG